LARSLAANKYPDVICLSPRMSSRFWDVVPAVLTIIVLSPVAAFCFRNGVPIEPIVFSLLVAGYKGPGLLISLIRSASGADDADENGQHSSAGDVHAPSSPASADNDSNSRSSGKAGSRGPESPTGSPVHGSSNEPASSSSSRRPWSIGWRRAGSGGSAADNRSWRSEEKPKPKEEAKLEMRSSTLAALKKQTPRLQWRGMINKFTPEKFDKLCEQLLATLPVETDGKQVTTDEFRNVLEELLALIFEASSRQHQYTEMYTDLCQKLLDFIAKHRPELESKACVWGKCQSIFKTNVLTAPDLPQDLPEDEYMDRKAKHKEKMVGIVKFGADLVSRGLVPCDGVMVWIHTLLSEKSQEVYAGAGADDAETPEEQRDKDGDQREVQLELLCAILAGMGSSMTDSTTLSEENRAVIEDVFIQLEQLSMDTVSLSLRIRCLIRDVLDLRMAQWKEKEGKLKPGMLQRREDDAENASNLREDAPEFIPGKGGWTSQRVSEQARWLDPQLLASLQAVEHHVEVIKDTEAKLERLKGLIKLYHLIQEQQLVVVVNASNQRRVLELIAASFSDVTFQALDFSTPELNRRKGIKSFELGETAILILASEVSTRRDFDIGKPARVLVNFDFPMTLQLYLYRIFKRADKDTHVYTFFSPHHDVRHTGPVVLAMESAGHKVPDSLRKLKDQVSSESNNSGPTSGKGARDRESGGRTPGQRKGSSKGDAEDDGAQRADRGDRGERGERAERTDRLERTDSQTWKRGGKGGRPESSPHGERDDRGRRERTADRDDRGPQQGQWDDRDGEGRGGLRTLRTRQKA